MAVSTTTQPNLQTTSLSGTVASTPATFSSDGPTTQYSIGAILTEAGTTITAYEVTSTTGEAVIDGSTLTWRQGGLTLDNGVVVSAGLNGIEVSTTTVNYGAITVGTGSAGSVSTASFNSTSTPFSTTLTIMQGTTPTTVVTTSRSQPTGSGGSAGTTGSSSEQSVTPGGTATVGSSSSSTSSTAAAPSIGAGKTVALIGALGGVIACGI